MRVACGGCGGGGDDGDGVDDGGSLGASRAEACTSSPAEMSL